MATNNVICGMNEFDEAIRQYQSQGCLVQFQSTGPCAVMDCKGSSIYDMDTPETDSPVGRSLHDRIDPAYADYWGEIPD